MSPFLTFVAIHEKTPAGCLASSLCLYSLLTKDRTYNIKILFNLNIKPTFVYGLQNFDPPRADFISPPPVLFSSRDLFWAPIKPHDALPFFSIAPVPYLSLISPQLPAISQSGKSFSPSLSLVFPISLLFSDFQFPVFWFLDFRYVFFWFWVPILSSDFDFEFRFCLPGNWFQEELPPPCWCGRSEKTQREPEPTTEEARTKVRSSELCACVHPLLSVPPWVGDFNCKCDCASKLVFACFSSNTRHSFSKVFTIPSFTHRVKASSSSSSINVQSIVVVVWNTCLDKIYVQSIYDSISCSLISSFPFLLLLFAIYQFQSISLYKIYISLNNNNNHFEALLPSELCLESLFFIEFQSWI